MPRHFRWTLPSAPRHDFAPPLPALARTRRPMLPRELRSSQMFEFIFTPFTCAHTGSGAPRARCTRRDGTGDDAWIRWGRDSAEALFLSIATHETPASKTVSAGHSLGRDAWAKDQGSSQAATISREPVVVWRRESEGGRQLSVVS